MVHFAAIHWVPVTLPVTQQKHCAEASKLLFILLMLFFPHNKDESAIMTNSYYCVPGSGRVFLNRYYLIYFLQQTHEGGILIIPILQIRKSRLRVVT